MMLMMMEPRRCLERNFASKFFCIPPESTVEKESERQSQFSSKKATRELISSWAGAED